jgi:hypothetical protein
MKSLVAPNSQCLLRLPEFKNRFLNVVNDMPQRRVQRGNDPHQCNPAETGVVL